MALVIILIVAAILFGLGGLLFEGLKWLLIISAVLLAIGVVTAIVNRRNHTQI